MENQKIQLTKLNLLARIMQSCSGHFITIKPHLMSKSLSKILKTSGFVVLLLFMFGIWYKYQYSMDYASTKEINNPAEYSTHVLIATQGSDFKDAVLERLLGELTVMESYIKGIDVSLLDDIQYEDWDAICIMHTWEQWRAPKSVERFIK